MTRFNRPRPERKSPRLKDYDYTLPGTYFVTICQRQKLHIFGEVLEGEMFLSPAGVIVHSCWSELPQHYPNMSLDCFVVMPNHTHAIILIIQQTRHGLTEMVRGFKTWSARRINKLLDNPTGQVWQRSFHDYIIRTEESLHYIRAYITDNPARWHNDTFYNTKS